MKYRVRIDLAFDKLEDASALLEYARKTQESTVIINADAKEIARQEVPFIQVEQCFHDEQPTKPCVLIYDWNKKDGEKVI